MTNLKQMNRENRPYEKFLEKGPVALTDSELLAIIIRTGTYDKTSVALSEAVLSLTEDCQVAGLVHLSVKDLMQIKGIGQVKAIQIKCIAELSRRIAKSQIALKSTQFNSPEVVAGYYMEDLRYLKTEHLIVAMLNTKNCFISDYELSSGTVNSSVISPRELFIEALRQEAVYIILVHNHPSGDPTPSREDILATRRIREAGSLIGISLIDHVIIGDNKYISLKQQHLL